MNTLILEKNCSDFFTESCPCPAALTEDCPYCSLLQKDTICDCSETWSGLCIYEKYLQQGVIISTTSTSEITVLQKIIMDNTIKIICYVPDEKITNLSPLQGVSIKTLSYNHSINLTGIVLKVFPQINLVTLIIKDTDLETPIKYGPILRKGSNLELNNTFKILPPLNFSNTKKVLLLVDGIWIDLLETFIDKLIEKDISISILGPFTLKKRINLKKRKIVEIISIDKSSELEKELKKLQYDTLISLNTPPWQKLISWLIITKKIDKPVLFVNNDAF